MINSYKKERKPMSEDTKAVAYHYVAKSLDGETQGEGDVLAENLDATTQNLEAEFLQVEVTPLDTVPDSLKAE